MQADEDVGKIALAVPVLVSKALELFLQDLCDRTYEITLQRGAKTLNSSHLKQCVKTYSAFDFLSEVVNKVPSLGPSEPSSEDMGITRRRKTLSVDSSMEYSEEPRSNKVAMTFSNPSPRGGGRGGGRGRGRGRPPKRREVNYTPFEEEPNPFPEKIPISDEPISEPATVVACNTTTSEPQVPPPAVGEIGDATQVDELAPWGLPGGASGDPSGPSHLTMHMDQDEDYDNED